MLYDRYSTKVFQKCVGMARDRDRAKDLTHDIFPQSVRQPQQVRPQEQVRHLGPQHHAQPCPDALRKNQRHQEQDIDERMPESLPPNDESEAALVGLRAERLTRCSATDPADRAILLMKYEDELPVADMQAALVLERVP
ncbi:MAG: hypothetical protein IPG10_19000 [Flavobacteriales bacterium]|nr:hypothetical protein [Flavobacteriales bacterium]